MNLIRRREIAHVSYVAPHTNKRRHSSSIEVARLSGKENIVLIPILYIHL